MLQSGGEASIIAEIVEVEENSTNKMQTLRTPPVLTVSKSAAYVLYELTYIRVIPHLSFWFHTYLISVWYMFNVFKPNILRMFHINPKNFMLELANVSQMLPPEWYTYVRGKANPFLASFPHHPKPFEPQ